MHRGTTVEEAGYKVGTSWPVVPDLRSAQDGKKYTKYTLLAAVPAMGIAFLILMLSGLGMPLALIGPAVVAILIVFIVSRLKKVTNDLIMNCKAIKMIADLADEDVEHTGRVVFDALTRKGGTERIAPLNDAFGIYVNIGYKMSNGLTELPYMLFIRKVDAEADIAA